MLHHTSKRNALTIEDCVPELIKLIGERQEDDRIAVGFNFSSPQSDTINDSRTYMSFWSVIVTLEGHHFELSKVHTNDSYEWAVYHKLEDNDEEGLFYEVGKAEISCFACESSEDLSDFYQLKGKTYRKDPEFKKDSSLIYYT